MRIAVVNDMLLAVEALRRVLTADGHHVLAWVARDGEEAVAKCAADTPDLILMDLIMPVMDGVEATRRIMLASPCAILVVTATVTGNSSRVYEALGAGAVDVVETPALGKSAAMLLVKLDQIERRVLAARVGQIPVPRVSVGVASGEVRILPKFLVGVGASAGGPAALVTLTEALPVEFGGALVIVQHIDAAFVSGLVNWLALKSPMPVEEAVDGGTPQTGRIYVAGGDHHLVVDTAGRWRYLKEPQDSIYQPSIDVFFRSMASNWKRPGAGVVLTGMGRDGSAGLLAMRTAGFTTIAQAREGCAVYGMPKAAAELGAATQVLPLEAIAPRLHQLALVNSGSDRSGTTLL